MLGHSKDKIDEVYASLQEYFKIENDGDINKYLGMELNHCPDLSIHLRQPYPTQIFLNIILGMENSSTNPIPCC